MSYMFYSCLSLISIPDITKWNTHKTKDMSNMFNGCLSLTVLPDLSKWKIPRLKDMSNIFNGCSSLVSSSDISKQIKCSHEDDEEDSYGSVSEDREVSNSYSCSESEEFRD